MSLEEAAELLVDPTIQIAHMVFEWAVRGMTFVGIALAFPVAFNFMERLVDRFLNMF